MPLAISPPNNKSVMQEHNNTMGNNNEFLFTKNKDEIQSDRNGLRYENNEF